MTGRAYIWRNVDTNLAEIHEEMSELVDKQVNVQKESFPGFTQNSRKPTQNSRKPTKKCAMKMKESNKQRKKKRRAPKIFFDGGRSL